MEEEMNAMQLEEYYCNLFKKLPREDFEELRDKFIGILEDVRHIRNTLMAASAKAGAPEARPDEIGRE